MPCYAVRSDKPYCRLFLPILELTLIQPYRSILPLYLYKALFFSKCLIFISLSDFIILPNLEANSKGISSVLKTLSISLTGFCLKWLHRRFPNSSQRHIKFTALHKTIPYGKKKKIQKVAGKTHWANIQTNKKNHNEMNKTCLCHKP